MDSRHQKNTKSSGTVTPISTVDTTTRKKPRRVTSADKLAPDVLLNVEGDALDEIYVLGQPPLDDYLYYVRRHVIDGDQTAALEEWRSAYEYRQVLEENEAGIADEIEIRDLDSSLKPLADELLADPRYRNTYRNLPGEFVMVELDRLVISQLHVTRQYTDIQQARLGVEPDAETVFHFCQPTVEKHAPVKVRKVGSQRYIFSSASTDFRSHDPVLLRPDQISEYETYGPISGVVGLVVGFGPNYLSAVRYGDRLILRNGYHRAYALRAAGVTHAPCIVKTANDLNELEVAVGDDVTDEADLYFESKRPPILKDFFDPSLCRIHQVRNTLRMIEVEFEIREYTVRA